MPRSLNRNRSSAPEPATREEKLSLLAVCLFGGGDASSGNLKYFLENLGIDRSRTLEILREAVETGW